MGTAVPKALAALVAVAVLSAGSCESGSGPYDHTRFNGHWVLEGDSAPLALEVRGAGTEDLAGLIVGAVGGRLQPFLESNIRDGRLTFRVARQFEGGAVVGSSTVAWFEGERLRGETTREDRVGVRKWTGRRPDVVDDSEEESWVRRESVVLFDGSDLDAWHTGRPGNLEGWEIDAGVLHNIGSAENLTSNRKFWNFELHVEYRVSEGGNSGIGLRGRYEVQIYDDFGREPSIHGNGAIYSRIKPVVVAAKPYSEWQTFDIRLIGRVVTVSVNGTTIIDSEVIQGLTAMALDADESDPGPILIQGDHGPIEFRTIVVTPLAKS